FFFLPPRPPISPFFPYTTLFRSLARAFRVQPARRRRTAREAGREGKGAQVPGDRAHRSREPLRRNRLLPGGPEGRRQADPRLRALRGARRAEGARLAGRRLRGREPSDGPRS